MLREGGPQSLSYKHNMAPDVVFFHPADVSDGEQHKAAFGIAVSKFETVDICVNNAGILKESNWEKLMAINVGAVIRGSLLALEHMRCDRGGRGGVIINVASIVGLTVTPVSPTYCASKHAVIGFTTSWAVVDAVMKLIQDPDNNGAILAVTLKKGARYRRRQVVDRDGVNDLVIVDTY
ncbi:hypothetical protein C0Q70_20117 [Pomacea canaliculata]|uniref:15-hydroxyprostaglandin dehydrogenase [NAD(+)] n=1 Tax=Pomacea canaliculata TaxID=400727 RepID=A0A2T7NEM0_POMCA|nr:hypothetical protein C0Q70_20117 [Pomacea canaliculata]